VSGKDRPSKRRPSCRLWSTLEQPLDTNWQQFPKEHPMIKADSNQLLFCPAHTAVHLSGPKPFHWFLISKVTWVQSLQPETEYNYSMTAKLFWGQPVKGLAATVGIPYHESTFACTHCQGQSCYHTDYNALNDILV